MKLNTVCWMLLISTTAICSLGASNESKQTYVAPEGMVPGGQFIDRILPLKPNGPLRSDVWGGENVLPRDVLNGMEDQEHSYWGGNIVKGDDGKFHMFPCRWREDNTVGAQSGHMTWGSSIVVHAVADQPAGPYKVVSVIGPGHNPEVYQRKDGTYVLGTLGFKAYTAKSLYGPWTKIETTFQWRKYPNNTSNRTYVIRDDGAAIVLTQKGHVHISEKADENFIELTDDTVFMRIPAVGAEDPVIWRDDVQYHCVYNGPREKIAFYMRSPDGIHWKWMEGIAYLSNVVKHEGGTSEGWYKLERPKILQDKYGRATHMNVAVMDAPKWEDRASDIHSSKNLVLPLRVSKRLEILNADRLTKDTVEISVRIRAEDGFNPFDEVDVSSLKFGAPEVVNFGGGSVAKSSKMDGNDLVVVFDGDGNGFEDHNFAAKMIGRDTSGTLIFGYAKMKRSAASMKDEIRWHTVIDEIPLAGNMKFAVSYRTTEERLLKADLINLTTGETVAGGVQKKVNGEYTDVLHFASKAPLNREHQYGVEIYLTSLTGKNLSRVERKEVAVLLPDAGIDKIVRVVAPSVYPNQGHFTIQVQYETKGKRDLRVDVVATNPRIILNKSLGVVRGVEGKGTTEVKVFIDPTEHLTAGTMTELMIYLTEEGKRGKSVSMTGLSRAKKMTVDVKEFQENNLH